MPLSLLLVLLSGNPAEARLKSHCPRAPAPAECTCAATYESGWEEKVIQTKAEFQACAERNRNWVNGKVVRFDGNYGRHCARFFCEGHESDGADSPFHNSCSPAKPSGRKSYFCNYLVHIYKGGDSQNGLERCEHSPNAGNTPDVTFPGAFDPAIARAKAEQFCQEVLVGELGYAKCETRCSFPPLEE